MTRVIAALEELGYVSRRPHPSDGRQAIVEITDYLGCAMVDQDDCMDEYKAKESLRREKTKKAIKLD